MALTRPRYSQIPDTDWKQSVRVATTADVGNVMLAAMPNSVDGVTLNFYDRVLLKSQANAAQNGIYYVKAVGTGANGIWERTKDASSGGALGAVTPSIVTQVEEGTINKNRTFKLTTTGNIDLGTTDLSFGVQAAEPAGATGQLQFANVNNVIGGATTTSYDYVTGNLVLTGNVNTTLLYQNGKRVPQVFTSATPPSTPAVGDQWYQIGTDILYEWLQDGATAYWIDVSGATIANINPITGENVGSLVVNGGNDSTSSTTGALQVVGGTGITGNLNVGGSITFGGGSLGSDLVVNSTAPSTSETTGAIRIASPGGLGVGGNIWVGGTFVANSRIPSTSIGTGAIILPGTGGLGVGGNVFVGQNLNVLGNITGGGIRQSISSGAPANPVVGDQWYQLGTDILYQYVSDGTGSYWVDVAGATVANITQQTNTVNDIHLVSGTPSTSSDTGALIVSGGVGIQGNLNLQGGFNITGGNLIANQNVTSTNTTTGSMVVTGQGGIGVGGNINIGGNLSVAQTASFLQNVIISANLVASGTYFAAGGLSVTNGNIVTTGTSAQIGGLTITNGAISGIASLGVTGATNIGGDLTVTGNIAGGGVRKYAQTAKPTNAFPGDVWYKTDTDVYYTYVNDGTASYWIDYTSATVANITPQTNQTLSDIVIVSGTPATNTTTGALQVQGGAGITGNVFTGNLSTGTVSAGAFTYANGVSILLGNEGTYSNANVVAYLSASNISVGGNLTAGGSYFSAGGLSVTAGNILATGARAVIGGLTIENGGISSLASLNVIGSGTLGGDFAITGNVTAGGLRKYAQVGAPANPVVGDVWYKTDTDVFYQYVNDGTNKYWIDYTSATVSNASPTSPQSLQDLQIVSGTPSTGSGTGALQVTGGAAVTGNLFSGNLSTTTVAASNFTYANGVSILAGNEGTYSNANVLSYLAANGITATTAGISTTGNLTASGSYLSAGGFTATAGNIRTTSANIGGVIIESGGIGQLASLGVLGAATIGGDVAITGNITAGGLRKYAQAGAPANPVVGDVWYKTDTDVYYQYINDGTNKYWIDYSSATVSNASPTTSQSLQDLQIVSGTQSTSTGTGALVVQGGIGASGNVFVGNVSTATVSASNFTYANGVSILLGNEGTYSNANVTAYLTARTTTISDGFLSTAGLTVTAGNLKTTSANIGGLIIENNSISQLASIGVVGAATIGADLAVTGNITGGGLRKYAQAGAPANPIVGDVWYKTDTDVYYQYINDGTNKYWVDYAGATVSNASITSSQISYDIVVTTDTQSTSTTTGAVRVQGGIGLIGNIYTTGIADIGGNLTAGNIKANNNLQTNTLAVVQNATVGGTLTVTGAVATGNLTTGNITGYGFTTDAGNLTATGQYFSAGGVSATAGNISIGNIAGYGFTVSNGNITSTGTRAVIGGLEIINGGFGSLASLGVTGAATFGANVDITGRVTGGGIRKTSSTTAPASPIVGDTWYKTDTDTLYQYINDGTSNYWIDISGATVANISPQTNQTLNDIVIVSGTPATNTTSGALQVQGGAGITGNVFAGNLSTTTVAASNFTYANGVSILLGNEGTYSNANVTAYLTAKTVAISDAGNVTSSGTYFNTAGLTVLNGNVTATGTTATIGGLVINNGSLPSLPTLGVLGAATIGGDIAVTGNITAGGLRKYAQVGAPTNPVVGDVWYKTDTDVFYQYVNDGTNKYWIDYTSATVSNANPTSPQSLQDLQIVSGTPSTSTTSGALQVTGGAGISGNVNAGNVTTGTLTATTVNSSGVIVGTGFTYANGVSILVGNEGTYSNSNVTAYLTARTTTISDGFLSTAGMTVTAGNLKTTSANIGGVVIESGGIGSLASLNVIGGATIGGDIAITGNITGGGIRKTSSASAPATPTVGDQWYKTDTDTLYQYINDGTSKYWIDVAGATVSNASITSSQIAYDIVVTTDTQSTSTTTGAIRVQGGIGLIGNIYTTGIADFGGNLTAGNILSNNNLQTTTLQVTSDANVTGNLSVNRITASGNITSSGQYFSAAGLSVTNGNIITTGTTATIAGLQITNGALPTLPTLGVTGLATFGANIDVTGSVNVTGNITGGGLRKYAQIGAPANPVVGDVWYKTDTDVYYQYINDGTNKYWIDYSSATVSNASPTSLQSIQDLAVVGGTVSTSTSTGAITILGGVGLSGNINVGGNASVGNLVASGVVSGTGFTYANGVSILVGNEGTYSNSNVTAYLTARTTTISDGYLSTAGITVTAGNIFASSANIAGVIISSGGLSSLASLGVVGGATIGGDLAVTGNITGGGIRKTTSISAPTSPVVGDQWYKQDTDTLYQYINDGTTKYWVDVAGATVSNARTSGDQIAYDIVVTTDTQSTSPTTGAVRVQGGIGLIGNIYTTGIVDIGGNLRADNITANNNVQTNTLQVIGDTNVNKLTAVGNITSSGTYFSAGGISVTNGNVVATGTSATIGGLVINNGGLPSLPTLGVIGAATFGANVDVTGNVNVTRDIIASGNIVAGGVRKYAQTSKPTNAVPGDVWYKTDTDVYYTYINDGTSKYWIDYVGATVSNAAVDNSTNRDFTIASGTLSTDPTTGALVVVGGVGITGDINTTGDFSIDGTFTACTAVTAGYLNVADGIDSYGNVIIHGPGTANYTVQVRSSDAADNVLGIKTSVAGGGFAIDALNNELIGATPLGINANTFSIGIKNAVGSTVQADALKVNTAGNVSIAKTLSIGQHVDVTGNVTASNATFVNKITATTANFTTMNLSGTLTVPTLNVTTTIDAPGIRKYAQTTAPASPAAGDVWYKTDTDVYYTYVNDGTANYWIDYAGATVSNAAVSTSQSVDLRIASGTESTNTDTGALTVVGGIGLTGNINANYLRGTGIVSDRFTFSNGASLAATITGTYSNTNVAGYLSGSITAGSINVTGTLTAPGIRKTQSITAPASPVVGDLWYKTDTDVYYQYINDGTSNYWVDYVGATVSNAAVTAGAATDYAFTSGTPSTSTSTGAVVISGGVGISGDLFTGGFANFGGNVTVNNLNANVNVQTNTLVVSGSGAIVGNLTTGNLATGIATIARADIAGTLAVGGDVTVTGNIVAGGVRKTQSTSPPVNPVVGDLWYKTDTDVYYQYTSDGVNKYWIDYVGATVSNAAVQNSSSVDFTITSGTESTNTTSGALTIVGGVGITGNINAGNVIATSFRADNFLFANGRTLADRITGTYSNSNVTAYLTGSITTGDLNAGNITAGNIATTDITSRDITARNVALSGNITGGGLRKYAQAGAPANPILGDVWYKTDTDVYYQYINDGANYFWVDYVGPTVSNAAVQNGTNSDFAIASGTLGTSPTTGALVVTGGVGVTGNIYTTGIADFGGNLRADNVTANVNLQTNTLAVVQNATVGGTLNVTGAVATGNITTGNITGYGFTTNAGNLIATGAYLSAGGISATSGVLSVGNIISSGTRAVVGGLTIENGAFGSVASLAVIAGATFGGDVAITGNITAGGLRKYAQTTAPTTPVVGDVWYKTDTDVYYQYINDGTSKYWIDYSSATVSNASPTSPQSLQDLQIVSGTASTSTTSGALQVTGGAGISGNVTAGNVVTAQVTADKFTYANGVSILAGNEGTYSNANVTAYLTARSVTIADGNITANGGYLAAGGFVATAGNIRTTSANIGGVVIESGGIGQLASIGVIGSATIGADLAVTGNITGGGLRKYAQDTAPTNPVVGDVWYKTDTDVYYQYINDGTTKFWVDYVGATVSNASITSSQISYDIVVTTDTQSTSTTTGAIRVQGGIGLIGNIYTTGIADIGGNLRAGNITANNNLQTNTLAVIQNATVGGVLTSGTLSTGNSSVGNIAGYGFTTNAGNLTATGAYFAAGGMSSTNGNITVGNINAYSFIVSNGNITSTGTYARVGGLEIVNGGFTNLTSLGVVGAATIGADLAVTGNITGGGLRKYTGTTAPANPVTGDVWYKTDTDVYYQYITDGTSSFWVDYTSATVANITLANAQYGTDVGFVSGTTSTNQTNGAVTVIGGVGVTGNINLTGRVTALDTITGQRIISNTSITGATLTVTGDTAVGNLIAGNITGYGFTTNNGNVVATGQLTVGGLAQVPGNLTATGSYFSAGGLTSTAGAITGTGFSITAGNIITTGQKAVVGGLTIENGALPSLPSIGVIGSATIGADLAVTGNITGGGLRKYAQTSTPANPVVGDVWYKTDTDVYYQYITDGTTNVWVDYTSATVANITLANAQYGSDVGFVSGTTSTNQTNGAVTVIGGIGVTGNINLTGRVTALDTVTGQRIISNTSITGATLSVAGDSSVGNLTAGNVSGYGFTTNNGNVTATGNITGYGFVTSNGNLSASGAYFSAGGMTSTNGNITVGNINAYSFIVSNGNITSTGTYARVGGLEIVNGGFGSLASLGVTGAATFGANVDITGRVTGGGIRKTSSTSAPAGPVVGDQWYKTDTDILYQYINDGASNYWIDMASATVANVTQSAQTVSDLAIVSGTPSTSTSTGALRVAGGVGITGDIYTDGNLSTSQISSGSIITNGFARVQGQLDVFLDAFIQGNTITIQNNYTVGDAQVDGNVFLQKELRVGGNVTAYGLSVQKGNLVANGAYFSAGGLTSTAGNLTAGNIVGYGFTTSNGNVTATGTYARVGGLEIINGGFGSLASIGVIGSATIGGDVAITGNITAGGLRKYAQTSKPANPVVGDVWYKTDTDVYYQYINDGSANVWVDFVSATVANITTANAQYGTDVGFVSGTLSTNPQNGAVTVIGGVGVTGSINLTGQITAQGTITGQTLVSNGTIFATTIIGSGSASFRDITAGDVAIGNINSVGFTTNNGNVVAGGNLTAYGLSVQKGNLVANGAYFSAGGLSSTAGAITGTGFSIVGGNIITTGQKAVVGGLTIENGAFGNVASLGVIGSATIGADLAVTGNITGGGLRKYAQTSTPANPIVGDVWYKTDADIYYTYVNDGTSTYWIDYTSAAIANITVANSQYGSDVGFVSGTLSTNQTNGAVVVIGGVGVTGNINLTGRVTALDTITGQRIVSNTSIAGATLSIAGDTAVGNLTTGSITATGNVTATGKLTVGGLSVVPGNLSATGSYLSVNGFTALNGNITATGTTATIGGLTIANGGFGSVASLAVIGAATVGGDVAITGNITAGGVRKTTSLTAPANPVVGDQWYKTDTDILYQFMDDGTTKYWVDFASATVANITSNFDGLGDFTTIGNVIGNGIVSNNYYYANGVSFVTTTVANTQNIVANITNGFNLGLNLTKTGVTAGNYGSATSIPTIVTDDYGRITSITSNAVSTTFGLVGNVGTSSINGGNTLVIVGVPNQISTTVTGNTISIGFTPNITFTDFTVSGNLVYQGGGIKTTTSPTPPNGPINGDMWYQSGTDILYRYVNDGTNEYWLDLFSTPLRAILPSRDIGGGDGEVQFNDNGTFGANARFKFDKTTGTLQVDRFRITQSQSPATPGSPGNTGEITWDGNWMYVCVAPNSWVRAGLYTW